MKLKNYLTEQEQDFDKALKAFLKGSQQIIDDDFKRNYPNLKPSLLSIKPGKKYVKIIVTAQSGMSRSVWAFIDKATGDILKPASWKAPAKHARGNIFDQDNGTRSVTAYGPGYLQSGRKKKQ
jgi:hypothetical protein